MDWVLIPESTDGNNALLTAIATFGIIGVGASEILVYPIGVLKKDTVHTLEKRTIPRLANGQGLDKGDEMGCRGSMLVYLLYNCILSAKELPFLDGLDLSHLARNDQPFLYV